MASTIKIRTSIKDGLTTVRALIKHPMETSAEGRAPHYIKDVVVEHEGVPVMTAYWGQGVSKNPYLSFKFAGAVAGDKIRLSWVDNKGETDSLETAID